MKIAKWGVCLVLGIVVAAMEGVLLEMLGLEVAGVLFYIINAIVVYLFINKWLIAKMGSMSYGVIASVVCTLIAAAVLTYLSTAFAMNTPPLFLVAGIVYGIMIYVVAGKLDGKRS